jgi:hypothetical protein
MGETEGEENAEYRLRRDFPGLAFVHACRWAVRWRFGSRAHRDTLNALRLWSEDRGSTMANGQAA